MSRNTPWSKQNSSLPSDRIKGTPNVAKPKPKPGAKPQPAEPPKSRDVRRLEALLAAVASASGTEKDPAGGCFCLARTHALSPYAPICTSCGLILCTLNPPQHACPHCAAVLLAPAARAALVAQLEADVAAQLEKEALQRERAIEDAQRAAGAFPSLSGAPSTTPLHTPAPAPAPPSRQTHKVMSLTGARRGGVLVSSYTTTPVASRPASRAESPKEPEEKVDRVAPPPPEPPHATRTPRAQRPWENLLDGAVDYRQPSRLDDGASAKPASRRNRGGKARA